MGVELKPPTGGEKYLPMRTFEFPIHVYFWVT